MKTNVDPQDAYFSSVANEKTLTAKLPSNYTKPTRGPARWLLAWLASCTLAGALSAATVIAPNDPINGISQRELSARWWQWMLSYPIGTNPAQDTTGAFGSFGSSQAVTPHPDIFFIAGNFSPTPDIPARAFVVPAGQSLFFPLVTSASSIPFFGITEAEIRLDAAASLGIVSNLFARLDGADLETPANLLNYRQRSPSGTFSLNFPVGNIFGAPPGPYQSVTDGYFVGLAPLDAGSYELQFGGRGTGSDGFNTAQTIHLIVMPEPGAALLATFGGVFLLGARRRRPSAMNNNFANLADHQTTQLTDRNV